MTTSNESNAVRTARDYYNSDDADAFYTEVWGGEDIHVGLYTSANEPIASASRRTVDRMADLAGPLSPDTRILDLGAGYGGAMRHLARRFGCRCVALNLAEIENERNRRMTHDAGLEQNIEIVQGDFTVLDFGDASFDLLWSQEAFLHAGDRISVCAEASRVLKPGGRLVFTDPMQTDHAPEDRLQPILDRLHLDSLASPSFYRETLAYVGMTEILFDEHPEQLARHYSRVREVLIENEADLREKGVSADYIDRMKSGLTHWVDGGNEGLLTWGIFVFEKGREG